MFDVVDFTPLTASVGGALIGVAAALLWVGTGRIAGISGHLHGVVRRRTDDRLRRGMFLLGIVGGAVLIALFSANAVPERTNFPTPLLIAGGVLVGMGTRLGSGCTSGHGVCGIGRGSTRSVGATLVFFICGVVTAVITRHLFTG